MLFVLPVITEPNIVITLLKLPLGLQETCYLTSARYDLIGPILMFDVWILSLPAEIDGYNVGRYR